MGRPLTSASTSINRRGLSRCASLLERTKKKTKKKMNSYEYFAMAKTLTDQAEKLLSMAKHLQAMGEKMLYKEIPRANQEDWDAEIRREEEEQRKTKRRSYRYRMFEPISSSSSSNNSSTIVEPPSSPLMVIDEEEEDWEREISISPEPTFKVPVVPARMKVEEWLTSCPTCKSTKCSHRQ